MNTSPTTPGKPAPNKAPDAEREKRRIEPEKPEGIAPDDEVDQASYDSFPASDPPAHSARHSVPGGKPTRKQDQP